MIHYTKSKISFWLKNASFGSCGHRMNFNMEWDREWAIWFILRKWIELYDLGDDKGKTNNIEELVRAGEELKWVGIELRGSGKIRAKEWIGEWVVTTGKIILWGIEKLEEERIELLCEKGNCVSWKITFLLI